MYINVPLFKYCPMCHCGNKRTILAEDVIQRRNSVVCENGRVEFPCFHRLLSHPYFVFQINSNFVQQDYRNRQNVPKYKNNLENKKPYVTDVKFFIFFCGN